MSRAFVRRALPRRGVWIALLALLATLFGSVPVASAAPVGIAGTWESTYHCLTGWCAGSDFPLEIVFIQAKGSSHVTAGDGSASGTLSGSTLTWHGGGNGEPRRPGRPPHTS